MTLTPKDAQILTQVAFKAAVDFGDDVTDNDGAAAFERRFSYFTESLNGAVEAAMGAVKPAPATVPTPAPGNVANARTPEQALAEDLGATPHIEIVNADHIPGGTNGPIPAWALKKIADAGTTRVYDNRADLEEYPTRPWFKDADDGNKAFWPDKPKGKGGKR
jgi:hypothetical protein